MLSKLLGRLGRFNYTIHNVIGHPLSELLHQLGKEDLATKVHDLTLPEIPADKNQDKE